MADQSTKSGAGWSGLPSPFNAPLGGGGPGRFCVPGTLSPFSSLPEMIGTYLFGSCEHHPLAPAARTTVAAATSLHPKELSGVQWCARFPTSTSTDDLAKDFRTNVNNFISALTTAHANVTIAATYRPPERAYLMHYAWAIDHQSVNPTNVPEMVGVDIDWVHRKPNGMADLAASRAAAKAMVQGYQMAHPAALISRHTQKLAIDMSITWTGNLVIIDGDGDTVTITSTPRTGAGNVDLREVGASFGVIKLVSDAPHWSSDGH